MKSEKFSSGLKLEKILEKTKVKASVLSQMAYFPLSLIEMLPALYGHECRPKLCTSGDTLENLFALQGPSHSTGVLVLIHHSNGCYCHCNTLANTEQGLNPVHAALLHTGQFPVSKKVKHVKIQWTSQLTLHHLVCCQEWKQGGAFLQKGHTRSRRLFPYSPQHLALMFKH